MTVGHTTIIAGTRDGVPTADLLEAVAACPWEINAIIEGGALGVDRMARSLALTSGIPFATVPAHWRMLGGRAGPERNKWMRDHFGAQALIALPRGESKGTRSMIALATLAGLPTLIHTGPGNWHTINWTPKGEGE